MTLYAIDEAMIAAARGDNLKTREEIIQKDIAYTDIFQAALMEIGSTLVRHNDCRCVFYNNKYSKPTNHRLTITGFESDVERVIMLDASLQIQCQRAMLSWWASEDRSWYSKMDSFKSRRDFIFGFAAGLANQLYQANEAAKKEAVKNEAVRSSTTETEASESVALVLRTKKEQVGDWYDNHYGNSLRSVSRNYQSGMGGGRAAGHAAGSSADVGRSQVGGRKALGR